jgi:hypothetical protein
MDVVDARSERMVSEQRREVLGLSGRAVFFAGMAVLAGWVALHPADVAGMNSALVVAVSWVLVGAAGLETAGAVDAAVRAGWQLHRWRRDPALLRLDVETEQAADAAAEAVEQATDRTGRSTGQGPAGGRF